MSEVKTPAIGEEIEVEIETIAAGGRGKGRSLAAGFEKIAFFVDGAAPGDRVRARVTGGRKRYFEAELVELLAAGPVRVAPPCPHYPVCGGCQLMHVEYGAQGAAKGEILGYTLRRRGLGEFAPPVTPSPQPLRYRVRSTLVATAAGEPAMQQRGSHDLTPLRLCRQMREPLEAALFPATRQLAARSGSDCARPLRVRGALDVESGRVFVHPYRELRDADSPRDWFEVAAGELRETADPVCATRVAGRLLRYAPDCFAQVNPEVNEALVAHALAALAPERADRVLELYAGVGNFTLPLAAAAAEVVAVEWPRAAKFGQQNARDAGLENARFLGGDVGGTLAELARRRERFDLLLADPPRDGLGRTVCGAIGGLRPRRLAYVSCEPQTLAADLEALTPLGYRLHSVAAFDMFPQTFHFESCVILELA
jgi:23S rRNA (uracil1939-C5)-methyltransferase